MERRLTTLLLVLGLIAVPAAALRAFCVGNSCGTGEERTGSVPFCSLPPDVRDLVTAGFYEGRSPDVLGVTGGTAVTTDLRDLDVAWPSIGTVDDRVPLVFLGDGIKAATLPDDAVLDQVAPTIEPLLGIERPFPEVRSGSALPGVGSEGPVPLVVLVVWKGVGIPELEAEPTAWPFLETASADGVGGDARPGSWPLDPAAILTTIGTGGLPSQHGIVGTTLRGERGPVDAFRPGSPGTVIATLGDDLDEATAGEALVGLVAADPSDRGLIGGTWYGADDDDLVVIEHRRPARQVRAFLEREWGADGPSDLLGLTVRGSVADMDRQTRAVVELVTTAVPDAVVVVTSTGSLAIPGEALDAVTVAERVDATLPADEPVIAAPGSGGFFLDDDAALDQGVTTQQVADAMAAQVTDDLTTPLFDDAFPSFTVRFGRYC